MFSNISLEGAILLGFFQKSLTKLLPLKKYLKAAYYCVSTLGANIIGLNR